MTHVTSQDGTTITYDRLGDGPPLILVSGALCDRRTPSSGVPLAQQVEGFTSYAYDRRGRGDSGDTQPYAKEREFEDLHAVIEAAGGQAAVYGMSSGGILALEAAAAGLPITALALYEPPYVAEVGHPVVPDYLSRMQEAVASNHRADALRLFMVEAVGMPAEMFEGMRHAPVWPGLEAIAPTLLYDAHFTHTGRLPAAASGITVPTTVLAGDQSPPFLQDAARATAKAIPGATYLALEGQTHDVDPAVLGPVLADTLRR